MRSTDTAVVRLDLASYTSANLQSVCSTITNMANEVLIVNCDCTYPLDSVVSLFQSVTKGKEVVTQPLILQLSQLQAASEEVRRRHLLCGVFVVNAYESCLNFHEETAGFGYAVLYKALLAAAQGRVVVVIGGDDRYKDGEQDTSVLSTWAYHKIAAQFDDSYLDGRRGFVFSWDERHNPVHEEALGRYLVAISSNQCGLKEPFKPKVSLQSEKTSATTQITEFNVPEKQAPTHSMVHDNTWKTGTVDVHVNSSDKQGKCDESVDHGVTACKGKHKMTRNVTNDVPDDPFQGASNQFCPAINNPRQTTPACEKSKKPVPEQGACQSKTTTLDIPGLIGEMENKVVDYIKDRIEKETKGRKVKVIEIYVNGNLKCWYDSQESGVYQLPNYFRKHIDDKKDKEEVVVAVIIDDGPGKRPPTEDLGLIFRVLADLKKDLPPCFWQGGRSRSFPEALYHKASQFLTRK